ncbi:hypothetical protein [uncultured Tenacibaculum sp.]|uniref:hypothetical protein n=1 Tax=uncultured Tenacibaculum sp. TaxID=174713 RepID=UPI00260D0CE2|nr:hypothetical protein [uncultured Tenacibaculum sp.]
MEVKNIWSVFEVERTKMDSLETYKERIFYYGDFSNHDLSKDSRFMEFKNRRKQVVFIGLIDNPDFPIQYPLKTIDNQIIDKL